MFRSEAESNRLLSTYSQVDTDSTKKMPAGDTPPKTDRGRTASESELNLDKPNLVRRQRALSETGTTPCNARKSFVQMKLERFFPMPSNQSQFKKTFRLAFKDAIEQKKSPLDKSEKALCDKLYKQDLDDINYLKKLIKDDAYRNHLLHNSQALKIGSRKVSNAAAAEGEGGFSTLGKSASTGIIDTGILEKTDGVAIGSANKHQIYQIKDDYVNVFVGKLIRPKAYAAVYESTNIESSASVGCLAKVDETMSEPDGSPNIDKDGVIVTRGSEGASARDFWQLVLGQNINRIIALQDFGLYLSYMPGVISPCGPWLTWQVEDRFKIEIIKVEQRDELKTICVENRKHGIRKCNASEITAQDVTLKITDIHEQGEPREVTVFQYFFWSDAFVLEQELSCALVDTVPDTGCLIHCQAGQNRSPALVAMKMLKERHKCGELSNENSLQDISDVINLIHIQRDAVDRPNSDARKTIIQYVEKGLGVKNADEPLDSSQQHSDNIQTAPVTILRPEFTQLEEPPAGDDEQCFSI